ncbi:hypothetical protein KZP23_16620 [Echinicola marina]|uniref:hypothetical protein n=1 Tax=Echinicola marina TaxID=2859768 RepID=UPI001CF6898D|nr:hypothetical protein [Echinicola marina]UCS92314.1 hypothetical protein KZP23_16620 [Echinicola marina]
MKSHEELEKFFQEGLANDLFFSIRHYFIFRTIGEHAYLINEFKDEDNAKILSYLQNSSHELCIISLCKFYDRKNRNNKYQVRCLETLLEMDFCHRKDERVHLTFDDQITQLVEITGIEGSVS